MKVIVVGAGVVGASAAWHLARAGAEVVLVDAAREGRATAASAGIVCPWVGSTAPDPDWLNRGTAAGRDYPAMVAALAEDGEADIGYLRTGALAVHRDPDVLARVARALEGQRAEAPEIGAVTRLQPAQARGLFPLLHPALGAVHIAGGARVDGRKLAASLRRAAISQGATALRAEARLDVRDGRVRGVLVGIDRLGADAVLLAAGAWCADLLAPFGIALRVAPQRGQIVHLRLKVPTGAWPAVLPVPAAVHYLVCFDDRVLAGATRETGSGFDCQLTAGGQAQVLEDAFRLAPGLAEASVLEWRVGLRPLSDDGLPLLGPVPPLPGLFVATGLGGGGLTLGPLCGRVVAQGILGRPTALDLAPYAPLR